MYFEGQKFFVAGLSRSGDGCARFLLKRGARVYVYDDVVNDKIKQTVKLLQSLGAIPVTSEGLFSAVEECDVLVISPGIPIDNPLPVSFRKSGKAIIGAEELACQYLRAAAIAVTGTNGKTTTVSMLEAAFSACGKNAVPCANYGSPLINYVEELGFSDIALMEISSFQLETLSSLRPHVAIVTNITEDHLNRHYNMENYVFLKSKLVRVLRESEFAVLNYDDERVRAFSKLTRARVVWFSARQKVEGAYVEGDSLYYNGEKYFDIFDLRIGGAHNVYNALACIAACAVFGLDSKIVSSALCAFKGVKHRVEYVAECGGVTYIDDSKATNVDATLKAVEAAERETVLLLGGKDKGYDYSPLFFALDKSKVTHCVIYGENRFLIMNAAVKSGYYAFSLCPNFNCALYLSSRIARGGQSVLLSPASASFDEFASYEERGDAFKKFVERLADEGK